MNDTRFIDMFSGIGGFRRGLTEASPRYKHVWSNDINKYANQIYRARFGAENHHTGDIREIKTSNIPDHDLLCAGFPCQAFSVAGQRRGFTDTRGTLFFEIARIIEAKKPPLCLLENVKGLLSHDEGLTYQIILESLEELGYLVEWQVLNSKHFGVPQNRERVFIVGHLRDGGTKPVFPITESEGVPFEKSTGKQGGGQRLRGRVSPTIDARYGSIRSSGEPYIMNLPHGFNDGWKKPYPNLRANKGSQYNELLVRAVQQPNQRNKGQNGHQIKNAGEAMFTLIGREPHGIMEINALHYGGSQQDRLYFINGISPSILASRTVKIVEDDLAGALKTNQGSSTSTGPAIMEHAKITEKSGEYGDGYKEEVSYCLDSSAGRDLRIHKDAKIRRLTPVECERLQGFPDNWTATGVTESGEPVEISDTQRYKALGNAVTVNVIEFLGRKLLEAQV